VSLIVSIQPYTNSDYAGKRLMHNKMIIYSVSLTPT